MSGSSGRVASPCANRVRDRTDRKDRITTWVSYQWIAMSTSEWHKCTQGRMKIAFLLTLLTLAACSKVPDTTCFSRRNCSLVRSSGSTTRRYLSETYADDITERFLHLELLSSAVVNPIKNEKCRTHLVNFIDGLRNSSSWAVESK